MRGSCNYARYANCRNIFQPLKGLLSLLLGSHNRGLLNLKKRYCEIIFITLYQRKIGESTYNGFRKFKSNLLFDFLPIFVLVFVVNIHLHHPQ